MNNIHVSNGPVNSVGKALRVLECFSQGHGSLTLAQISKQTGIPKSTALNLLRTMENAGYLIRTAGQSYQLGFRLLELGYAVRETLPIVQLAIPLMEKLQIQTGKTIYLTSHINGQVLYLEGLFPTIRPGNYSATGKTLPMHCTGCGKAMLAFLPEAELETLLAKQPLSRHTPNTITDPQALRAELAQIRSRGYAIDTEEETPGVKCIAVPIREADGYPVGAISISGTTMSMRDQLLNSYARDLSSVCQSLMGNAALFPAAQLRRAES